MSVNLLNEYHLEVLSLNGGCRGSSESTLVKCHIVRNHMSRLNYVHAVFARVSILFLNINRKFGIAIL